VYSAEGEQIVVVVVKSPKLATPVSGANSPTQNSKWFCSCLFAEADKYVLTTAPCF